MTHPRIILIHHQVRVQVLNKESIVPKKAENLQISFLDRIEYINVRIHPILHLF